MYSLPSASQMREPCPRTIYGGSPPTDLNARTGESTPPGITRHARAWSSFDFVCCFIELLNIPRFYPNRYNHNEHKGQRRRTHLYKERRGTRRCFSLKNRETSVLLRGLCGESFLILCS